MERRAPASSRNKIGFYKGNKGNKAKGRPDYRPQTTRAFSQSFVRLRYLRFLLLIQILKGRSCALGSWDVVGRRGGPRSNRQPSPYQTLLAIVRR